MCFHKSNRATPQELAAYYQAELLPEVEEQYKVSFHENGFDFKPSPIVTAEDTRHLAMYTWGFIAPFNTSLDKALQSRVQTLNCISEEMYEKPSFKDAANRGQRCLIPCSGFMEWKWMDEKGKTKIPYYVQVKDQKVFSLAGLYTTWRDRSTGNDYRTYTVLTTKANPLMAEIHNSKKRMPVIIPRDFEHDYLNPNLSKEDVLALCSPYNDSGMSAYTISKLVTSKTEDSDVEKVLEPYRYELPPQQSQTSLF